MESGVILYGRQVQRVHEWKSIHTHMCSFCNYIRMSMFTAQLLAVFRFQNRHIFDQPTITKVKLHFEEKYINYRATKIYTYYRNAATFVPGCFDLCFCSLCIIWLLGWVLGVCDVHYMALVACACVHACMRIYCAFSSQAHVVVNVFIHHFRSILFDRLCAPFFSTINNFYVFISSS